MNVKYSANEIAEKTHQNPPMSEQRLIIESPLEPAVVIAGAGSGKTEMMSSRLVYLVANGLAEPNEILGLTFTKKAATELSQRVRRRLNQLHQNGLIAEVANDVAISTYHSYAGRILGEHALRIGIDPPNRLAGEARVWQLADRIVNRYDGKMEETDASPTSVTGYVITLAKEIAEHGCTLAEVETFTRKLIEQFEAIPATNHHGMYAEVKKCLSRQRSRLELLPLVELFAAAKREEGELSFDDQMSLAARIAQEVPEVRELERNRYRVVLLDEYQDTSQSQLVLIKSLFGDSHPVTAVGDACQSIYGWRGASAHTLESFPSDFPGSDGAPGKVYPLMVSWRNDTSILEAANRVSTGIRTMTDAPLAASPKAEKGELVCGIYPTVEDEAEAIADYLAERWQEGVNTSAVLVRKRTQIPLIEAAIRARGLPVEVVGVGGLLLTPEVADLRATLEVLVNPESGDSLMRLLTGARWRIGPHDIVALARYSGTLANRDRIGDEPDQEEDVRSIVDALDQIAAAPRDTFSHIGFERLSQLSHELQRLRRHLGASLADLILEVEHTLGLDLEVAAHPESATHARRHLDRFIEEAVDFAEGGGGSSMLRSFLSYLDTANEAERGLAPGKTEVDTSAVQILTIHGAKGLEWDVVVIAGIVEGTFPAKNRGDDNWLQRAAVLPFPLRGDKSALPDFRPSTVNDQKELDERRATFADECKVHANREETRLGYVAVTRARHSLFCTAYWWGNGKVATGPSALFTAIRGVAEVSGVIASDAARPTTDDNPLLGGGDSLIWPIDPLGERRTAVDTAAGLIKTAISELMPVPKAETNEEAALLADAEILLREHTQRQQSTAESVTLPARLSVSALIGLYENPVEFARQIRRPMPSEPNVIARRGTAFHRWLEERFGSAALLDVDELPGSADTGVFDDSDLQLLQGSWLASSWADRTPVEVEVPFESQVDSIVLRGRIDAVYQNHDGTYEVVDWKTGTPKEGEAAETAVLQLAAYRIAWAQIAGVDPAQVSAAFHYVRANLTYRPVDLKSQAELVAIIASLPRVSYT